MSRDPLSNITLLLHGVKHKPRTRCPEILLRTGPRSGYRVVVEGEREAERLAAYIRQAVAHAVRVALGFEGYAGEGLRDGWGTDRPARPKVHRPRKPR